jgi:flagellar protein FliT
MTTMNGDHILAIYESIARLTQLMLAAARAKQWDLLVDLEKDCSAQFARLFSGDDNRPRDAGFQRRKTDLICRVLDDDAEIRLMVEPWLADLSALIGNTHQQQRLGQAYGTDE